MPSKSDETVGRCAKCWTPFDSKGNVPAQMAKAKNGAAVAVRRIRLGAFGRRRSARGVAPHGTRWVNAVMTSTYWLIGQRIVKGEQGGRRRAEYGAAIVNRLTEDLAGRFGHELCRRNLFQMRSFYLRYPKICRRRLRNCRRKGASRKCRHRLKYRPKELRRAFRCHGRTMFVC